MAYTVPVPIPPYLDFFPGALTIPKLYWDGYSQEQRIHRLCKELHKLCEYANQLGIAINLDHDIIARLEADFERFQQGGFLDLYEERLTRYLDENLAIILRKHMGIVWPAVSENGHFLLYSATIMGLSWDVDLTPGEDFGRIHIKY